MTAVRAAVVGHVEWVEFARVERVPLPGEIVPARSSWAEPAGGAGVAAVQLARLAGGCTLYTALGDDDLGRRAREELEALGVTVVAATRRDEPTRRAFTYVDRTGERTITVIGARLQPEHDDALPWDELARVDALYFTAGGPDALRAARAARSVVATARVMDVIAAAGVPLDAVVGSGGDVGERYTPYEPGPTFVVTTAGAAGGAWTGVEGRTGKWAAAPVPDPAGDAYGCGDSFAAGLTYGLAATGDIEAALDLGARCGAECRAGRGPYERQLTSAIDATG